MKQETASNLVAARQIEASFMPASWAEAIEPAVPDPWLRLEVGIAHSSHLLPHGRYSCVGTIVLSIAFSGSVEDEYADAG